MIARVHAIEARSRANGPGVRTVVWLQGCTLACPGCFNPRTHAADGGREIEVDDVVFGDGVEGLTLSGGEPIEQAEAAVALLDRARAAGLSTLMFSGFRLDEIRARAPAVLARLDVLIDGRYRHKERLAVGLRGSANQRIWLLTDRYTRAEVEATPPAEIRIARDGSVVLTGVDPLSL